jgi:hypothetical protein
MDRRRTLLLSVLAVVAGSLFFGGIASADSGQLPICCAWNSSLADGDLTYMISAKDAIAEATVRAAVEEWEAAVPGLTLTEVSGKRSEADIHLNFKKGGGVPAGSALRSFDRNGFVKSVKITISGMAFGDPNTQDTIGEIVRHEVGHALGLGHADFPDLMDPEVGGPSSISDCDVEGVLAAQHWALVDGASTPHQPHVTEIGCEF